MQSFGRFQLLLQVRQFHFPPLSPFLSLELSLVAFGEAFALNGQLLLTLLPANGQVNVFFESSSKGNSILKEEIPVINWTKVE